MLPIIDAGRLGYRQGWDLQQRLHHAVRTSGAPGLIMVTEHLPVVTFGRHADPRFLRLTAAELASAGVDVVTTDRGGEVTAHMPGQVIIYPIIRLGAGRLGPRAYVSKLEGAVVGLLAAYGLQASCDPERPGVFIGTDKVCAIGVRIRDHVSLHGLALNVANDLGLFQAMVPCGLEGRGVTSLQQQGLTEPSPAQIARELAASLASLLAHP